MKDDDGTECGKQAAEKIVGIAEGYLCDRVQNGLVWLFTSNRHHLQPIGGKRKWNISFYLFNKCVRYDYERFFGLFSPPGW